MHNTIFLPATFAFIPDFIQKNHELSMAERMTYSVIASVSGRKNFCWHSQKDLSERIGCSLSTFKRCICRLIELGLLATKANVHGHTLCYYPLSPSSSQVAHSELPLAHDELQIIKDNIKQTYFSPLPPQAAHHHKTPNHFSVTMPVRNASVVQGMGENSLLKSFEKIWDAYPKKEAIGLAKSTFFKMQKSLPAIDRLLDCISFKKISCWAEKETRYIPTLEYFLKGERWLDSDYVEYKSKSVQKTEYPEPQAIPELVMKAPEHEETPEETQGIKDFLSSITRQLSIAEKAVLSAFWRSQHRKGITLTAHDGARIGNGALFTEMRKLSSIRSAA